MRLRRFAAGGCSAATQKRSVETIWRRRLRSSRYNATVSAVTDPKSTTNWPSVRFSRYISSGDAACPNQIPEDRFFERQGGWNAGVTAAASQGDMTNGLTIFVKCAGVAFARGLVELQ